MHRLATVPGDPGPDNQGALIEQPPAPLVLLSSADTDLTALAQLLAQQPALLPEPMRALNLAALAHPAVIDHYIATSLQQTRVVVVRLLGGRGHWSYGLEQLQQWQSQGHQRQLLVLAGTAEEDRPLAGIGSVPEPLALALAAALREGGPGNWQLLAEVLAALLRGELPPPPTPLAAPDPDPYDWQPDPGPRVGLILYRALRQSGDLELADTALAVLRQRGLCPRALWVSSLRDPAVQRGVGDWLEREQAALVLCTTGFASVQFEEAGLGAPLWERLAVPVLQLLCSASSQEAWRRSSIGLSPLDLSLQVALPELDGRLTTRVAAFKEVRSSHGTLATALQRVVPDRERLDWVAQLAQGWIHLRQTPPPQRRVALVLANYPNRNGRLANGVGLDTPASAALMLGWLQQAGYDLGRSDDLPANGEALIQRLLAGRSNDPESSHRAPLCWLPLADYRQWYDGLPQEGRQRLEARWGPPHKDQGLENLPCASKGSLEPAAGPGKGFPIRGLRFGQVVLLIQPERGYDRDPSLNYHAPDLPPTHAYLAQYLWLRQQFKAQVVVHVGKHGNLEWLPGKGLGLSSDCFPEWALGPLPHLYPFIVNDPGEGSQAKRRAQAVILDHLTPPLGRAGLQGELAALEALLDEYVEAAQLGSARRQVLEPVLRQRLATLQLPLGDGGPAAAAEGNAAVEGMPRDGASQAFEVQLQAAEGYLCELKEAQIRLGLHTYGTLPAPPQLAELLLCLARAPQGGDPGFTQALARDLGLALDPWAEAEDQPLQPADRRRLAALLPPGTRQRLRRTGDGVAVLEAWALELMHTLLAEAQGPGEVPEASHANQIPSWLGSEGQAALNLVRQKLLPALLACAEAERQALLAGLEGRRIAAGPSGAPTRGRRDLLPTGRNFYSLDLRGLPTEAAWDLGRRSAALLLELHLQQEGNDLTHLALSVWGTATMRNGGEDIAQALALLGVQPVWDGPTRRLVDLEVIPLAVLGRPRVDVTLRISGLFRDAFPQLVAWFDRAVRLVAALEESEAANPLAAAFRTEGQAARIYGSAPGAYGAGLQGLIDSGQWEQRSDLGEAFLNWSSWRYGPQPASTGPGAAMIEAQADRAGLEQRLRQVQVILHNQDNREHDLLDSDDYYQFQGGLSAAAAAVSGRQPSLWFADHSRSQRPRVHRLEREVDKVLRSRMLNPRWIEGMQRHGYKGGFEMAASLDYLFAYDAATERMPDWAYGAIVEHWLRDGSVLAFLRAANPWALRDMAERLLEAHHRGLWEGAAAADLEHLRSLVLSSEGQLETLP